MELFEVATGLMIPGSDMIDCVKLEIRPLVLEFVKT